MKTLEKKYTRNKTVTAKDTVSVLHIIKSLGRGGAETLLPETLSKHNQQQFNFHYIYFLPWKDQMVAQIEENGGTVNCFNAKNNFQIFSKVTQISNYVRKHNIQVIHCHLPWAGIVGRLVGKMTGVPVVYTEHNKWERYHKLTYLLNKATFSSQQRVIAVSEDVAQSIKKHYRKQQPPVQVVLNGINTEKFSKTFDTRQNIREELNIPADAIVIGLACVFRVQKRLLVWLQIARQLHQQFPSVHFIIAGDGPLRETIFAKSAELQMQSYLHFVGLQPEIRPYLQAMDIFMMSSEFEGLPIALLEAMSMECMPASTAAGGIPELIKHEENGLLVPVDQPMQMVETLKAYLKQPEKIHLLAQSARQTVEKNFSMQQMVNDLEQIYLEIINQKH